MSRDLSGASWYKSSFSQADGDCVEVAHVADAVGVRDSKNPTGAALAFAPEAWDSFINAVRSS
ncbi:DUF397 domain-containing protein [Nocardia carnea]|uniref:DUF397 domain-containing protein n=1 Tax=Nocardia carnea TaxID=37328 RepID=UPI002456DE4A|nr:DUF397 domain-containing protein [Nocardia carnea]